MVKITPQIEAMARADAEFDGRPFDRLGRSDRDRYLARSVNTLSALAACPPSEGMRYAVWFDQYKSCGATDEEADSMARQRVGDASQREQDNSSYTAMIMRAVAEATD